MLITILKLTVYLLKVFLSEYAFLDFGNNDVVPVCYSIHFF